MKNINNIITLNVTTCNISKNIKRIKKPVKPIITVSKGKKKRGIAASTQHVCCPMCQYRLSECNCDDAA